LSNNEREKIAIISGYISNKKGRSLAGVNVKCDELDTITLFNGFYKFNVKPGSHMINVEIKGYDKKELKFFIEENGEKELDFILEEEIGKSRIYGIVMDKETGEWLVNGSVILIQTSSNKTSNIDPKTSFYEFNNLTSGIYNIWTSITQYKDEKQMINIGHDEEKRYDFHVEKKEDEEVPWG
jgi:hypothetical protein